MRTLLLAGLIACGGATAQPAPPAAFEAASVKPNHSGSGSSHWNTRPGNLVMQNVSLRTVIVAAYHLKDYQVVGPSWLESEHFDIVAKAPLGTPESQIEPMLGPLLAEKFKLAAHRESKDFPVYGLVIAKGGLKVKATEGGRAGTSSHGTPAGGELKATNTTMAGLAGWLSRVVDRPVVDQSGDTGAYDFTLKYSREDSNAEPSSTVLYPILTLAIQEQIGVRLEKRTAPVEILVIDHVEKVPVEN